MNKLSPLPRSVASLRPPMRVLIFIAGAAVCLLGILASKQPSDPAALQGGLTLGGVFIICGLFSIRSKWHGIVGAGMVAFLGLMRALPALWSQREGGSVMRFEAPVAAICGIVLITALRTLLAERRRIAIEKLKAGDDGPPA
jgi:hypothetical protein